MPWILHQVVNQLSIGEARGFLSTLGPHEFTDPTQPRAQRFELCRSQRLLRQLAVNNGVFFLREKLPRFVAAGSTLLEI